MVAGTGGTPPPPAGYQPPPLPGVAAGSVNIFRGRLVIVFGPSGVVSGIFVYQAGTTPALGNPPVFWSTSSSFDPYGNVLPSTVGVAGSGIFQAGNTVITVAGMFTYSGTGPGPGNEPVFSVVSPGTTQDPYGNAVASVLQAGNLGGAHVQIDEFGEILIFNGAGALIFAFNPVKQAFFTYSPSFGAGNLAASLAAISGTDAAGNAFPAGAYVNQLTLANVAAPGVFANSSILYSSTQGRLRYKNAAAVDMVLPRGGMNVSNFTMGTQTLPQQMSGPLQYQANEGFVGTEFGIRIDGTITAPTSGVALAFTAGLFVDGSLIGSGFTLGTVMFPLGVTVGWTLLFRLCPQTTGPSGGANVVSEGTATRQNVNYGNTGTTTGLNRIDINQPFDTTVNHTLAIFCNWGSGASSGHSAITYNTEILRSN